MDRNEERKLILVVGEAAKEILSKRDDMAPRELRDELYRELEEHRASKELIAAVVWKLVGDDELVETPNHRLRLVDAT